MIEENNIPTETKVLLENLAKEMIKQNLEKTQYTENTNKIDGITIEEAVYDYRQGEKDRKEQRKRDQEVLKVIIAGKLDVSPEFITVDDDTIYLDIELMGY